VGVAGQETALRRSKSIAGTVLAGLGMFILYKELVGAVTRLRYVIGANGSEALAGQPAGLLALSQAWQCYVAAQRPFLQGFIQHMLVSFWPLLLVMAGTVLARDIFTDKVDGISKKDSGLVDSRAGRSTSE
jgi:hypothetical protein